MRLYRVIEGPARLGQGEVVALLPAQVAPRAAALVLLGDVGDRTLAKVDAPVEFKRGEVLAFENDPRKPLLARLEAVDPEPMEAPAELVAGAASARARKK